MKNFSETVTQNDPNPEQFVKWNKNLKDALKYIDSKFEKYGAKDYQLRNASSCLDEANRPDLAIKASEVSLSSALKYVLSDQYDSEHDTVHHNAGRYQYDWHKKITDPRFRKIGEALMETEARRQKEMGITEYSDNENTYKRKFENAAKIYDLIGMHDEAEKTRKEAEDFQAKPVDIEAHYDRNELMKIREKFIKNLQDLPLSDEETEKMIEELREQVISQISENDEKIAKG